MPETSIQKIAHIRYFGEKTKNGIIDLTSASYALAGLSEILRFFNSKQNDIFTDLDYEIPIKVQEGSWETAILDNPITSTILLGGSIFAASYLKKAGEKIAENDFKDVSLRKIIERSMSALIEFIKIKKQGFSLEQIKNSKDFVRNGIIYTSLLLPNGATLEVEHDFLEWYKKMPPSMMQKLVYIIEEERRLEVAVEIDGILKKETITENEKEIFITNTKKEEEELILPHLIHGKRYQLEGVLTRGNQSSNSLGFQYSGHTLNCYPETGDVVKFKDSLFKKCIIDCHVNRNMKTSLKMDRKPTLIIISSLPVMDEFQPEFKF